MSTAINQYIFYGLNLPYGILKKAFIKLYGESGEDMYEKLRDQHSDNGYKKEVCEHMGLTIISDGMNGKYEFLGKVYEKETDGHYISFFSMRMNNEKLNEMTIDVLVGLWGEILQEVLQVDKDNLKKELEKKCELCLLTHYH